VVFPDAEDSNWDYDEVAGKWFLHRFYSHVAELLGNRHQEPATTGQPMALAGFGYRWLRLPG
jgi:hypothetical protein